MRLPPGWYAILEGSQLRKGRPLGARRFGVDLVAWRDQDGCVALQEDRCPHRSARLSCGTVDRGEIVCPFHAFRFGADGQCRWVPELGRGIERMRVRTFPVREAHGLIWAWWGPADTAEAYTLPWFEDLDDTYACAGFRQTWETHFTRSVENQLDYAHLPYVHRRTIGRFVQAGAPDPEIACAPDRIRWEASKRGTFIEFRFPNVWQNRISRDFAISLCFVPVDADRTELILRSHVRSFAARLPILGRGLLALHALLNRVILGEDRRVVLSQHPLDVAQAEDELLVRSDRAIRYFRAQMAAQGWSLTDAPVAGGAEPLPSD